MRPSAIALAVSLALSGCSNYMLRGSLVPHGPDPTVADLPDPVQIPPTQAKVRKIDDPVPVENVKAAAEAVAVPALRPVITALPSKATPGAATVEASPKAPPAAIVEPRPPRPIGLPLTVRASSAPVAPASAPVTATAVAPAAAAAAPPTVAAKPEPAPPVTATGSLAITPAPAVPAPVIQPAHLAAPTISAAAPVQPPAAPMNSAAAPVQPPAAPTISVAAPVQPPAAPMTTVAALAESTPPKQTMTAALSSGPGPIHEATPPATLSVATAKSSAPAEAETEPTVDTRPPREPSTYFVVRAEQTGVQTVFDDAHNTYIVFESAIPAELVLFGQDGEPIKYDRYGTTVVAKGVHRGILIRTYKGNSYAAPGGPLRQSRDGMAQMPPQLAALTPAKPAAIEALPPVFGEARARIAQAQDRLTHLSSELEQAAGGNTGRPLTSLMRDIEQVETRIRGVESTLVRVHFADSSSRLVLSDASRDALLTAARKAKLIIVRGRTDATGRADINRKVAKARAETARKLLVAGGIDPKNLKLTYALGDYVATNRTAEGRAQNRRAEIVLVGANNERIKISLDDGPVRMASTALHTQFN